MRKSSVVSCQLSVLLGVLMIAVPVHAAYPMRVADARGKVVTIQSKPVRIVSLAPSITETLFALGLGDRVVGVTRFCAYPPEARTRPRVGGYFDPSYEAIVALRPDLVVILREHEERYDVTRGLASAFKRPVKVLVLEHATSSQAMTSRTS